MTLVPHDEKPEHGAAVNHSLPVQLPPEAIEEFQAIWKNHYGEEIGLFKTRVSSISRVLFRRTAVRRIMGVDRGTEKNHG